MSALGGCWVGVCAPWIPASPTCPSQTSPKLGCSCVPQPKRDRTLSPSGLGPHQGSPCLPPQGRRGLVSPLGKKHPRHGDLGSPARKGQNSAQTPAARGRPGCGTPGALMPLMREIFFFPFASSSCRTLSMLQAWWQRLSVLPASWDVTLWSVHPVWHRGMEGTPGGTPWDIWLQPWGCLFGKGGSKSLPWGWEGHRPRSCPRFKPSLGFSPASLGHPVASTHVTC